MNEEWKPINGYVGVYEVSNKGAVRSVDRRSVGSGGRTYNLKGRVIQPSTSGLGYKRVVLYSPGVPAKTCQIHCLVLEAFVGPRPQGEVCRHLNGDPEDNRLENLAWGTFSENKYDMGRHGTDHQRNKTHCPYGHRLEAPNLQGAKLQEGWRACKACHQACSDRYNGSSLGFAEIADMRYYMILTQQKFKHGTRKVREREMYEEARKWFNSLGKEET